MTVVLVLVLVVVALLVARRRFFGPRKVSRLPRPKGSYRL